MASFNALSQAYSTRRDVSCPTTASIVGINQSYAFLLKQALINAEAGGTMSSSARVAGTIRTVRNSCDGVTAGAINDGVDRWTTTFDAAKLVGAADGIAHSWIVLEDATHQFCISLRSSSTGIARIAVTPKTTPFSAGTLTSDPTSSAEWCIGSSHGSGVGGTWTWVVDATLGGVNRVNFVSGADGQWYYFASRGGTGVATMFCAHVKAVDPETGTVHWLALNSTTSAGSARGSPSSIMVNSTNGVDGRATNGALFAGGGLGPYPAYGGGPHISTYGADARTSKWNIYPMEMQLFAPLNEFLGELLDLYAIAAAPVGSPNPSNAARERIVLGEFVIPFSGAAPLL